MSTVFRDPIDIESFRKHAFNKWLSFWITFKNADGPSRIEKGCFESGSSPDHVRLKKPDGEEEYLWKSIFEISID